MNREKDGSGTRLKIRIKFKPTWEGSVERWALRYCLQNEWRTLPEFDRDDLFQEAYFIFAMVCERYWQVNEARHFMRLFQICLRNRINRLSNDRTRRFAKGDVPMACLNAGDDEETVLHEGSAPGLQEEMVDHISMVADCDPIQQLFTQLVDAEAPIRYRRYKNGARETTNEFLCRVTNKDPEQADMVGAVLDWAAGKRIVI